jgi:hypothetical protein
LITAGPQREFLIEPEHYIPVSKSRLINGLASRGDLPERFLEFCRMIEAVYHFENLRVSQELKEDFRLLERDEGVVERAGLSADDLHRAETRFLSNLMQVMKQANFRLLTQDDVEFAHQEEHLFNLPVQVDWDKLDARLLGDFLATHGSTTNEPLPEFANRILIFRRGVGIDRSYGYHILPKLDHFITRGFERLIGLFRRTVDVTKTEDDRRPPPAARTSIHPPKRVERISLRNSGLGPRSLFQRTTLQEPTFKELVILFRLAPALDEEGGTEPIADPTIYIKAFRDIPMSDLEVVFPEKKISMKPLDLIKLVVTGTIGLVLFVVEFAFAALLNPFVALAALFTVGGYAGKVFFGFRASRHRYQHLVTQSLYHKNLDNDLGVIFYLMDSLETQEFKEAVLAYYCLLAHGPSTIEELDGHCERLMLEQFDCVVNFEISDALEKLQRDRLVEYHDGRYRHVAIPEALKLLDRKWDEYFSHYGPADPLHASISLPDAVGL